MAPRRDDIDPLTAELSRLSTTVSRRFLQKLKAARAGLSHASPGATTEQVLERALDLLLEKQARARGQVKRPRRAVAIPPAEIRSSLPTPSSQPTHVEAATPATNEIPIPLEPPLHRRAGPRETIPAAVRRAVWERDQGCCSWPLDAGGRCGSTHRLELDHVIPWARDGEPKVENLRLLCGRHNRLAARQVFGNACVDRYAGPGSRKEGQQEGQQGVLSV
jgi:5-methylcytosine-specific restriction endonuclease McrA